MDDIITKEYLLHDLLSRIDLCTQLDCLVCKNIKEQIIYLCKLTNSDVDKVMPNQLRSTFYDIK